MRAGHRSGAIAALFVGATACGGVLDAGHDEPHGLLPVDERNPVVVVNDGPFDNWQGEYALLLANGGGPPLAGLIIGASSAWPDIDANLAGWRDLLAAARSSGLRNVPDPLVSNGAILARPADGEIDHTVPNRSDGAAFLVDTSRRLAQPFRPVVIATGTRLTDVADAYLIDPTISDRVVVVSSLGTGSTSGGTMEVPNGEMDPWADTIVAERMRYVQVSAFYDQTTDVPESRVAELPGNDLGAWIASKRTQILAQNVAADQVALLAVGVRDFVVSVSRVSPDGTTASSLGDVPNLSPRLDGNDWLVTASDGSAATARLWSMLADPAVYGR